MGYEPGGYADKLGNRFEGRWVVRQLLLLLHERLRGVTIEAVGDDEAGVDLWIDHLVGRREAQQCKGRNGPKGDWSFADLARRGVLANAKRHLDRSPQHDFALVSAVPATWLRDLSDSARNSSGPESFYDHQLTSAKRKQAYAELCQHLEFDLHKAADREFAYDFLYRSHMHVVSDDRHSEEELRHWADLAVAAEPGAVIAALADFAEQNLRKTITAIDVVRYLQERKMPIRRLAADERLILRVEELFRDFVESVEPNLAAGHLIPRHEADAIVELLDSPEPPETIILHGPAGHGKSGVLYQLVGRLRERGTPLLAVRLDRKIPRGGPRRFGVDLGLPESPVICLEQLAVGHGGVLILDQLDALRWTSAHAAEGLDVCKGLVREVRAQRELGRKLTVVIACRSFDLEHDPQIKSWLKPTGPSPHPRVNVKELPETVVRDVVRISGVDPARLSRRRLSLLSCVQNLAMWAEIIHAGEPSPDFDSATGLMRAFWRNRRREIEKAGLTAIEREGLLNELVDHMEQNATLSAPARIAERSEKLATELQTLGVIQVRGRTVTFCHQSYLDFLVAERAAAAADVGKRSVSDWLGDRSRQSLFRREQLRQLLFLIADDNIARFASTVRDLLAHPGVRFHMKQLTLEALGQVTPKDLLFDLTAELLEDEQWREHVLTLVVRGSSPYVRELARRGMLQRWLTAEHEDQRQQALWLLGTVVPICGDVIAGLCGPLVADSEDWRNRMAWLLVRSEPESEPRDLFELRLAVMRGGAAAEYVNWSRVAEQKPGKAIRLLAALLENLPERSSGPFGRGTALRARSSVDWRAVVQAAARRPKLAWRSLWPHLIRLAREQRRELHALRAGVEPTWSWRERTHIPTILVASLMAAGRQVAGRSPENCLRLASPLDKERSRVVRHVLAACYAALPPAYADDAVRWLLGDPQRLRCGSAVFKSRWHPARRLIASQSPHCSPEVFRQLERTLLAYRDPDERKNAQIWLEQSRRGAYYNRFGAAQHVLLPALCPSRRSPETIGRIGVLERKFSELGIVSFGRPGPRRGGRVRSPINPQRVDNLSDRAWLKIITSSKIPRRGGRWRASRFESGDLVEASTEAFSREFRVAALRHPERMAQLALQMPADAPPDYLSAVLHALCFQEPPSEVPEGRREGWSPASAKSVQDVLEKIVITGSSEQARAYSQVITSRDDLSITDSILDRLVGLAEHDDPRDDDLNVHCNESARECAVDVLEMNAINCVRGWAARAMAVVLFAQPELLGRLQPTIERLLDDPHPAVRVAAAASCLPVWNVNRALSVQWLIQAAADDERVGACHDAKRLFNFAFPEYESVLAPLVRRMIASSQDDVAEAGATQAAARWIFFGLFADDLERCCVGTTAQRKGIAKVAAELASEPKWMGRSLSLLSRFLDDEEEEVRQQTKNLLHDRDALSHEELIPFLRRYVRSRAYEDDPVDLVRALERYDGSLVTMADLVFDLCDFLSGSDVNGDADSVNRRAYASDQVSPVLLRLYEQSDGPQGEPTRQRCLDAWDNLLRQRAETAWSLTRQLDR